MGPKGVALTTFRYPSCTVPGGVGSFGKQARRFLPVSTPGPVCCTGCALGGGAGAAAAAGAASCVFSACSPSSSTVLVMVLPSNSSTTSCLVKATTLNGP